MIIVYTFMYLRWKSDFLKKLDGRTRDCILFSLIFCGQGAAEGRPSSRDLILEDDINSVSFKLMILARQ